MFFLQPTDRLEAGGIPVLHIDIDNEHISGRRSGRVRNVVVGAFIRPCAMLVGVHVRILESVLRGGNLIVQADRKRGETFGCEVRVFFDVVYIHS